MWSRSVLDPERLSLGQEMQQAGDPVGEGDPIEPNPIPTPVPSVLAREYVWGPGDGPAGVDELLAQCDELHQPIWILQDASGDIVAAADLGAPAVRPPGVPETVPADAFTARLVWLGSHEAYGGIVAARTLHPRAPIHAGHKGLFVERLDAGVIDGLPGLPGVGGGTGRVEIPRLAPGANLLAHARNRWLRAGLGTWTSNDPNASGQITVARALHHGGSWGQPLASYSLEAAYADGPNLFAAYRATPMGGGDPLGLYFMPGPSDYVTEVAKAMIETYAANQEWDVEWALDWNMDDEWHTRGDNSWVTQSIGQGLYNAFEIDPTFGLVDGTSFNPLDLFSQSSIVMPGGEDGFRNVMNKPMQNHHIAAPTSHLKRDFERLFPPGMTFDDPANLIRIQHQGRHNRSYHAWVYGELQKSVQGINDPKERKAALQKRLRQLGHFIKDNPHIMYDTSRGRPTGWKNMRDHVRLKNGKYRYDGPGRKR